MNLTDLPIQEYRDRYPELRFDLREHVLWVGSKEEPETIAIRLTDGEITLYWGTWHDHKVEEHALNYALNLLGGCFQVIEQYRAGVLTACWLEYREDDKWNRQTEVLIPNPFDEEEWELAPDEEWTFKRRWAMLTLAYKAHAAPEFLDRAFGIRYEPYQTEPIERSDWIENFFSDKLGQPPEGFRWSSAEGALFALPVPKGWKYEMHKTDKRRLYSFTAKSDGSEPVLWIELFWKDAASFQVETVNRPAHFEKPPSDSGPNWRITFEGSGDEDMMANITLMGDTAGWESKFDNVLPLSARLQPSDQDSDSNPAS